MEIANKLKRYCHEKHIPLYMFAEDEAASGGYMILSSGDKIYSQTATILGSIGAVSRSGALGNAVKDAKLERRRLDSNESSFERVTDQFYEKLPEESKRYLLDYAFRAQQRFIKHIESHRGDRIKIPKDQRMDRIYTADCFTANEALEFGLIDGIGTYDEILKRDFPGAHIVNFSKKSYFERLKDTYETTAVAFDSLTKSQTPTSEVSSIVAPLDTMMFYSTYASTLRNLQILHQEHQESTRRLFMIYTKLSSTRSPVCCCSLSKRYFAQIEIFIHDSKAARLSLIHI
eukprot:TRINITY_DN2337_c0_g1_i12.p1 TRINITY_DN2337_c0_g1~~TRINITY_DN2337_c0_g1_i12.p1  ORF type:complete len:288 (+),score=20.29 TRINITY_DN2337_c0_g1_i12:360-1223(+)